MSDTTFMQLAIQEAKKTNKKGNYPVGAILVANNKIIAKSSNKMHQKGGWVSHAEVNVLAKSSAKVKNLTKNGTQVTLYSTLEPCLMCLGASRLHRISRIVYACPDPHGGATNLNPAHLRTWYLQKWPEIVKGPFAKESYELVTSFMRKHPDNWSRVLAEFEK